MELLRKRLWLVSATAVLLSVLLLCQPCQAKTANSNAEADEETPSYHNMQLAAAANFTKVMKPLKLEVPTGRSLRSQWSQARLEQGYYIEENSRWSPSWRFELRVQSDKNIVVYDRGHPVWASQTCCDWGLRPFKLYMQRDGNLVGYDTYWNPFWSTNTWGVGKGPYAAVMQDDGNFVVYDGDSRPLWSSWHGQREFRG